MDPSAEIPHQAADSTTITAFVDSSKRLRCSVIPSNSVSKVLDDNNTSSWHAPVYPLDDENLLQEILLRLPPQPSSIPRASLVCKLWRSILSDTQFLGRFRKHHRKPPLLGLFVGNALRGKHVFTPIMEPPNRIPSTRFSLPEINNPDERWIFTGCRHGFVVLVHQTHREIIVWDPFTNQQHRVNFPASLDYKRVGYSQATVLCADDEVGHVHGDCFLSPFKLVFIFIGYMEAFVSLYDSTSCLWGNVVSTTTNGLIYMVRPTILARNKLYWSTYGRDILSYDIERQTLGVIERPNGHATNYWCFQLLRMKDGRLGLATLAKLTVQLWERTSNFDGVDGWMLLQKIVPLEGMLPRGIHSDKRVFFVGHDEDTNVIVLTTIIGIFMLQLDSMDIRLILKRESTSNDTYYPYKNFYTTGRRVEWKWLDLEP